MFAVGMVAGCSPGTKRKLFDLAVVVLVAVVGMVTPFNHIGHVTIALLWPLTFSFPGCYLYTVAIGKTRFSGRELLLWSLSVVAFLVATYRLGLDAPFDPTGRTPRNVTGSLWLPVYLISAILFAQFLAALAISVRYRLLGLLNLREAEGVGTEPNLENRST